MRADAEADEGALADLALAALIVPRAAVELADDEGANNDPACGGLKIRTSRDWAQSPHDIAI